MANECMTTLEVKSEKIKDIEEVYSTYFGSWSEGNSSERISRLIGLFYNSHEEYYEDDNPKWVFIDELTESTKVKLCSAWHPPTGLIKRFLLHILKIDPDATLEVKMVDEDPDNVGGGFGSKAGYLFLDESMEYDELEEDSEDESDYWETRWDAIHELQDELVDMCRRDIAVMSQEEDEKLGQQ